MGTGFDGEIITEVIGSTVEEVSTLLRPAVGASTFMISSDGFRFHPSAFGKAIYTALPAHVRLVS
jgi:hypothetical protein